jgi:hypothetical protein
LLALEAVSHLSGGRPLIFGVEPRDRQDPPLTFSSGWAATIRSFPRAGRAAAI